MFKSLQISESPTHFSMMGENLRTRIVGSVWEYEGLLLSFGLEGRFLLFFCESTFLFLVLRYNSVRKSNERMSGSWNSEILVQILKITIDKTETTFSLPKTKYYLKGLNAVAFPVPYAVVYPVAYAVSNTNFHIKFQNQMCAPLLNT